LIIIILAVVVVVIVLIKKEATKVNQLCWVRKTVATITNGQTRRIQKTNGNYRQKG
jgi:hypothetical protein